jgi:hypothetical protein
MKIMKSFCGCFTGPGGRGCGESILLEVDLPELVFHRFPGFRFFLTNLFYHAILLSRK